jgi:hypothetical protein
LIEASSAHGDSQENGPGDANNAIGVWIDTANEFGDPIPKPKGRRLIFA